MQLKQANTPYSYNDAGKGVDYQGFDDDFSDEFDEEEEALLDATVEQIEGDGQSSPNKDDIFMAEYSIQDNIAYTVSIAISQYAKIVTLTYAILGGFSDGIIKKLIGIYGVLGVALLIVKLDGRTNISLLSYILSIIITMLIYSKLNSVNVFSKPNADGEEETLDEDGLSLADSLLDFEGNPVNFFDEDGDDTEAYNAEDSDFAIVEDHFTEDK